MSKSGFPEDDKRTIRLRNKLRSIRHELEGKRIRQFDQVFAILSETRLAKEIGISFNTLRKKVNDPTAFTVSELMRMADLFGVEYDVVSVFIQEQIKK